MTVRTMKALVLFGACAAGLAASGETYTWTGNENGLWTNAANWTVGGEPAAKCPGVTTNEVFDANGDEIADWYKAATLTDIASFGAVAPGAATTIDFDGLVCVSTIVFCASCSAYTLGTSVAQYVPLQAMAGQGHNGGLTIEKNATVPTLVAALSVGVSSAKVRTGTLFVYIRNDNTAEPLVIGEMGRSFNIGRSAAYALRTIFAGSGSFRFTGPFRGMADFYTTYAGRQTDDIYFQNTGAVSFETPQFGGDRAVTGTDDYAGFRFLYLGGYTTHTIEIKDGCRVSLSGKEASSPLFWVGNDYTFFGGGTFQLAYRSSATTEAKRGTLYIPSGKTVTVACAFDIYDTDETKVPEVVFSRTGASGSSPGDGTLYLRGTNASDCAYRFTDPATVRFDSVAGLGTGSEAYFASAGTFEHAGAVGGTFAHACRMTAEGVTGTIRNAGAAMLAVASELSAADNVGTVAFRFDAQTAPLVFAGSVGSPMPLVKTGASTLKVASAADVSNVTAWRIAGGTLDLSERTDADLAPLSFDTDASSLVVPDGVTVTLAGLSATDGEPAGTLNIVCGTGRVKVADAGATPLPVGVTVNGYAARILDDGTVAPAEPTVAVPVAARGGSIPSAAGQTVGILAAGDGANTGLAAPSIEVGTLVQAFAGGATVALGADETLTAAKLMLWPFAGDFAIGESAGEGRVAGAGGRLVLENVDVASTLTVRGELADGTDVSVDGSNGKVVLAGGQDGIGTAHVADGTLTVSGERRYTFDEVTVGAARDTAAKLVFDGAKDVVFRTNLVSVGATEGSSLLENVVSRMVVTNSTIVNCDIGRSSWSLSPDNTTENAILVGNRTRGILEIHAGSVISNRINVGGAWNPLPGTMGAVLQDGGEVTVLGHQTQYLSSSIGLNDNNGYYLLTGGRLVARGSFTVGNYGPGTYEQRGGTALFTNTLSGATGYFGASPCNRGNGTLIFSGGLADFGGYFNLASGGISSKARMVVEGEADVRVPIRPVQVPGNSGSGNTYVGDVALNGGTLRCTGFEQGTNGANYTVCMTVGFNGGTFIPTLKNKDVFSPSGAANRTKPAHVIVYGGGAVVDTDGRTGCRASASFEGATGKGVKAIRLPAASYGGLGAPPSIVITGDGYGAVALPVWDVESQTFSGIRIASPGCGYTSAKATVYKYGTTKLIESDLDCELAENANEGSFTKAGAGDFELAAANGWGGDTVLAGGTLKASAAGAIPAASTVVFAGGTLAVSGEASAPTAYAVDYAQAAESGTPVVYDGDLDFPEGSTLTVRNFPEEGVRDGSVKVLRVTGTVTGTPTIVVPGLDPEQDKVTFANGILRISKIRGLLMIVR